MNYADIPVDGNVHFIGTQGVGKSTVLRALLFFYNADKMKLGISKEKKSFDEYYFPYANSYVIYEVKRDEGCYLVMAFRSQGRACFRFLDIAYDKDFFISPEGRAFDGWDQIREALGVRCIIAERLRNTKNTGISSSGITRDCRPSFASLPSPKAASIRIFLVRYRMFSLIQNWKPHLLKIRSSCH